jgi:hypothetical protein
MTNLLMAAKQKKSPYPQSAQKLRNLLFYAFKYTYSISSSKELFTGSKSAMISSRRRELTRCSTGVRN